jgi:hypothetical protein
LANDTWRNLISMSIGFLPYSKDTVIRHGKGFKVLVLNSNQSNLESHFSHVQLVNQFGSTTLAAYGRANTIINVKSCSQSLKRGRTYDRKDDSTVDGSIIMESLYKKQKRQITTLKKYKTMLDAENLPNTLGILPFYMCAKEIEENVIGKAVLQFVDGGYLYEKITLLTYAKFIFQAIENTGSKVCNEMIQKLYVPKTIDEIKRAENIWRQAVLVSVDYLQINIKSKKNSEDDVMPDVSMMYLHWPKKTNVPWTFLSKFEGGIVVSTALNFVREAIKSQKKIEISEVKLPAQNEILLEIYIYFGYAVFQTRKFSFREKYAGKLKEMNAEVYELMQTLSDIGNSFTERNVIDDSNEKLGSESEEIFTDDEFLCSSDDDNDLKDVCLEDIDAPKTARDVEPIIFQCRNKGGLTRPVVQSHPFAERVLNILRKNMCQPVLHKDSLHDAYNEILENTSLFDEWQSLCQSLTPGISKQAVQTAYIIVLRKLIHSRGSVYIKQYVSKTNMGGRELLNTRTYLKAFKILSKVESKPSLE